MKLTSKTTIVTALLLTSAIAAPAQAQSLTEMINSANTSYNATETEAFSYSQTSLITSRLLEQSQMQMSASPMTVDGQAFFHSASDPTAMLHVDTLTRSILFSKGTGDIGGAESTPALPTKEDAPALARTLLNELELAPAAAQEMIVEHVGGLSMGVQSPDGEQQIFEKLRTVRFGRELGGQRVVGRGSRVVVQLGESGEMRGIVHRWNEVVANSIAPEAKLSAPEVRQMIRERLDSAASHAKSVEFTSAEVVLYDDGLGVVEPVIRVEVQLTIATETKDEKGDALQRDIVNPLDFFVPILRNPKADLPFVKDLRLQNVLPSVAK